MNARGQVWPGRGGGQKEKLKSRRRITQIDNAARLNNLQPQGARRFQNGGAFRAGFKTPRGVSWRRCRAKFAKRAPAECTPSPDQGIRHREWIGRRSALPPWERGGGRVNRVARSKIGAHGFVGVFGRVGACASNDRDGFQGDVFIAFVLNRFQFLFDRGENIVDKPSTPRGWDGCRRTGSWTVWRPPVQQERGQGRAGGIGHPREYSLITGSPTETKIDKIRIRHRTTGRPPRSNDGRCPSS